MEGWTDRKKQSERQRRAQDTAASVIPDQMSLDEGSSLVKAAQSLT